MDILVSIITMIFVMLAIFLRQRDLRSFRKLSTITDSYYRSGLHPLWAGNPHYCLHSLDLYAQTLATTTQILLSSGASGQSDDKNCMVSIGAQSSETTVETYYVVMTINKTQTHVWPPIILQPQQKWVQMLSVTPAGTTSNLYIEARLYRDDNRHGISHGSFDFTCFGIDNNRTY